ncbi:hypothetical protein HPB49_021346 [Dermacentor silvarum]|uniref:Uncharacterized protein n=2 Tax=Dermacentor silvarum TaxID=543639 RepID=A0ACB8CHI6_DERSI|nr:hypothetical protein HPB49_021346 [Dermacentor silvarum]
MTGSLPSRGLRANSENDGTHFSEPEDQSAPTVPVKFACKKKKRQPTKALRSFKTQTKWDSNTSSMFLERKRWRRKERALRAGNDKLRRTVDAYKEELRKLKEECYVSAFLEVVADAEEGTAKAVLLLDQVKNYKRKTPRWSEITIRHGIVLRHLSTKAYEYLRCEELLKLPCRTTLQKYFGTTSGEVGFSELVRSRLEAELNSLDTPQSKVCSLVVDEMRIKQKLLYHKQRDAFVGDVDLGPDLDYLAPAAEG